MTYSFPQFKIQITNPTISVVSVTDNIQNKACVVSIELKTESSTFGVDLSGFNYVDSWEDADILVWVNQKIVEFEA